MSVAIRKDALRASLRAERKAIGVEDRKALDAAICRQVVQLPQFVSASVVLTYLSMGAEVDTYEIIRQAWHQGKDVALPRCVEGERAMRWYLVSSFDGLVKSDFGVLEPDPCASVEYEPDGSKKQIALVPGFAFSPDGHRLGYGGGFYDSFLSDFIGASVGLCRPGFLSEDLVPVEPHDIPVDIVVTGR